MPIGYTDIMIRSAGAKFPPEYTDNNLIVKTVCETGVAQWQLQSFSGCICQQQDMTCMVNPVITATAIATQHSTGCMSSQAKVLTGGGDLREAQVDVPVCQPFLCLIAQLGSITDTLTLTGNYAYTNDFEVRLRALTELTKNQCLGGTGLIMGGINFAWLAVWVLSPDCPSCKQQVCNILGAWVKPPRLGEGSAGRAPTLHPIPWHLPYN